jgi:hypothetical protein
MPASIDNFEQPPQVLNYVSAVPVPREQRSPLPWLALFSGILAWIPVFLSLLLGDRHTLFVAPLLGIIGLMTATISVIGSDPRSTGYHLVSVLSLISTFLAIWVAVAALLH